jgi:hypothetical protein
MITRFCAYTQKVYGLWDLMAGLTEPRQKPQIPIEACWLTTFLMFVTGHSSLNAMEGDLKWPKRLDGLLGERKPSADRLAEVFELIDPDEQRGILQAIIQRLLRNKVLQNTWPYRFVALDGHEFFSSRSRSCEACSERTVTVKDEEVTENYHRGVVAHLVGYEIPLPLDVEMTRPGEGEVACAKRLIDRLVQNYPRLFDGVVVDALYFEAPFVNHCLEHGKQVVGVAKGVDRLLLKDAEGVFSSMEPEVWKPARKKIRAWHSEDFTSFEGVDVPVRVLHTEETTRRRERKNRKWVQRDEVKDWWWFCTAPSLLLPTRVLWQVGHARWDIEDSLFNVAVNYWAMNHCFHHEPMAILNFILTLFIALILFESFYHRNLKPQMREFLTHWALRQELHSSIGRRPYARAPAGAHASPT